MNVISTRLFQFSRPQHGNAEITTDLVSRCAVVTITANCYRTHNRDFVTIAADEVACRVGRPVSGRYPCNSGMVGSCSKILVFYKELEVVGTEFGTREKAFQKFMGKRNVCLWGVSAPAQESNYRRCSSSTELCSTTRKRECLQEATNAMFPVSVDGMWCRQWQAMAATGCSSLKNIPLRPWTVVNYYVTVRNSVCPDPSRAVFTNDSRASSASSAELTRKDLTTFDTIHAWSGKTVKTLSQIAKF